jgi:hypothetical protein
LPRISCGNHKINLAVKNAIKRHETMRIQIRKLNIWVTKIRKSVELTKVFGNSRCRLRLDNETRWGSSFLMLEQIVKADKRGLLNEIPMNLYSYYRILKYSLIHSRNLKGRILRKDHSKGVILSKSLDHFN